MHLSAALPLFMLAGKALAVGCSTHTFGTCADGIVHWYDPDDGQICDPLDCGGGRAPPKTDVPGCPQYKGTAIRQTGPSYMPCFVKTTSSSAAAPPTTGIVRYTTTFTDTDPGPTSTPGTLVTTTVTKSTTDTAAPATTEPATLPAGSAQSSTASSSSTSTTSTVAANNAGKVLGGSLMAAMAGVAVGAVALL